MTTTDPYWCRVCSARHVVPSLVRSCVEKAEAAKAWATHDRPTDTAGAK